MIPGEVVGPDDELTINDGKATLDVEVVNTGDRPVQVGSHFHFAEANAALSFDRVAAHGFRADIPAGTAVRFEPGITMQIRLVEIRGHRIVAGLNNAVAGPLDDA